MGLTRTLKLIQNTLIFEEPVCVTQVVLAIKPDIMFHLSSMTNADECAQNAITALQTNGVTVCEIADCIHKNKLQTKLIHTSSCELFKGHPTYIIQEDDDNFRPSHPYAYAKYLAHQMLDHYRVRLGCWVSNAMLFTTESKLRKPTFFFKKCVLHVQRWLKGDKQPLQLGSLDNFRNINHAEDVAAALVLISKQTDPQNYLVCGTLYHQVKHILLALYEHAGISLCENTPGVLSTQDNQPVIMYNPGNNNRYFEANINGNCTKLYSIGWTPKYDNLSKIFDDLLA
jgi:GDP-D-mannose dehydratase